MFDCVKDKPKPVVINPRVSNGEKVIALVIPHNKKSQGADNYFGESEYYFGKRIINKMKVKLGGLGYSIVIIERPVGSYSYQCSYVAKMCERYNVDFSLHLHFNSASYMVLGCEVLIDDTQTDLDNKLADVITDLLNERYGFKERGNDGVKTLEPSHNGHGMLKAVASVGTIGVLVEPCFANIRTKESALIFEQEDKYVDVLVDSVAMVAV